MICVKDAKASLWECITRVLDCASDDAKQAAFHNKKGKKRKLDDYKWDGALQSLIDLGAESIMLKCEPSADSIPVEAVLAMERRARAKLDSRLSEVETRLATSQGEVSKLKDDVGSAPYACACTVQSPHRCALRRRSHPRADGTHAHTPRPLRVQARRVLNDEAMQARAEAGQPQLQARQMLCSEADQHTSPCARRTRQRWYSCSSPSRTC